MRKIVMMTAAALLLDPGAAIAQGAQQAQQQQQPAAKADNPNEIVCEKEEVTGSRIASKRVCMTRSQWADQRRSDRMDVEKVQMQRGCTKNGC
jgi:hypothetical protein